MVKNCTIRTSQPANNIYLFAYFIDLLDSNLCIYRSPDKKGIGEGMDWTIRPLDYCLDHFIHTRKENRTNKSKTYLHHETIHEWFL